MPKTVHVIGNGDSAMFYNEAPRKGLKLACNLPPFPIEHLNSKFPYFSLSLFFKVIIIINCNEYSKFSYL